MLAKLIGQSAPPERIVYFVVPSLAHKSIRVSAPGYRSFLWRAIGATSLRLSPSDQSRPPSRSVLRPVHRAIDTRSAIAQTTPAKQMHLCCAIRCNKDAGMRHKNARSARKIGVPIQARNRDLVKCQKRYNIYADFILLEAKEFQHEVIFENGLSCGRSAVCRCAHRDGRCIACFCRRRYRTDYYRHGYKHHPKQVV